MNPITTGNLLRDVIREQKIKIGDMQYKAAQLARKWETIADPRLRPIDSDRKAFFEGVMACARELREAFSVPAE